MRYVFIFLLILLVQSFPAQAQEGGDITVIPVNDHLSVLTSPHGGNVTVSTGEDGTFIIDDQLSERSAAIEAAVTALGSSDIDFILNTHYHFDHTGGNEFFGGKDAIIVAHENVRERLSSDQFISYFNRDMPALDKAGWPIVTFTTDMTVHYNGDDIRIVHAPHAHTDGDSAAHFVKQNVIVAGDLIFNGIYPFIDVEHGGSVQGIIAGLDKLLELADEKTVIVPGHGPLMNKAELEAYRDMLQTIAGRIEQSVKDGKSLEDIVAMKPTAEFDGEVAAGIVSPDAFVGLLYESFSK